MEIGLTEQSDKVRPRTRLLTLTIQTPFKIYLCGYQARAFLDITRSFIEWMGTSLMREFEKIHGNPFKFDNLSVIGHPSDLERMVLSQKIFISMGSTEHGFTKMLMQKFVADKNNLILFLQEPTVAGSPSHALYTQSSLTLKIYEKELLEGEDLRLWKASRKEQEQQAAAEEAFAALQKRRINITDELAAAGIDLDEFETEPEDEEVPKKALGSSTKKEDLLLVEDIHSAQMLKEIYWSDYKNDWYLDIQKDSAMRAWVEDPEGASLSILGGITPGYRYQAFPVASGVISAGSNVDQKKAPISLYPSKIVNSPYGIILDFNSLYPDRAASEITGSSSLSAPQVLQSLLATRRAPLIHKDERPHRFVPKDLKLAIRCQRKYLDWSGLCDGKSLRIFLSKMSPRRTILVGACAEATEFLYNHLTLTNPYSQGQDVTVVAPSRNYECVNVTQSQILLPATISDDLAAACRVIHYNGFELGNVRFLLNATTADEIEESERHRNVILNKPTELKPISSLAGLLMIGDLKLPHIKRSLTDANLNLEFSAGDLVVSSALNNRKVATIRKNDEGNISLEGEVCPEYFKVRKFLYSQLAIISSFLESNKPL